MLWERWRRPAANEVGGAFGQVGAGVVIDRCYATGEVYHGGAQFAGGFAGYIQGSVNDSWASGNVYGSSTQYIGGFTGSTYGATANIQRSFATGNVFGSSSVGGFVGHNNNGNIVNESYSIGSVSCLSFYCGGFIGSVSAFGGTFTNNYTLSDVVGNTSVGGFVGNMESGTFSNNYSAGEVVGNSTVNAFVGELVGGTLINNYWNSDITGVMDGSDVAVSFAGDYEPLTTTQMKDISSFNANWDFSGTGLWTQLDTRSYPIHKNIPEGTCIDNSTAALYNSLGTGSLSDPYVICNAQQFRNIPDASCGAGGGFTSCDKHFVQGASIDFKMIAVSEIGEEITPFSGSYNGRGHSISNYYNSDNSDGEGLFTYSSANIKNLILENSNLMNTLGDTGLLVGRQLGGSIHNITAYGQINGQSVGLIGNVSDSSANLETTIIGVKVFGDFTSAQYSSGGIVADGSSQTYISKSFFAGTLNAVTENSGGIVGEKAVRVKKSKTTGSLIVSNGGRAGGVIGESQGSDAYVSQVMSSMDISTNGTYTGGIWGSGSNVGEDGNLSDSYSYASTIDANGVDQYVGGMTGYRVQADRSYANNIVQNSTNHIGGIAGGGANGSYNYWNTAMASLLDGDGLGSGSTVNQFEGRISAQLDDQSNFVSWDFTDVWAIGENIRSPMLRWDLHPLCQANMTSNQFDDMGAGSSSSPYRICFKEQLKDIATSATGGCNDEAGSSKAACGAHFMLMNDIDLKGEDFTPIGTVTNRFNASFEGNNHIISNLYISSGAGMFTETLSNFRAQNLTIVLANVNSSLDNTGIFVGHLRGQISNINVSGILTTTSADQIGGLVGVSQGSIFNSKSNVSVNAANGSFVGGLVGSNLGLLISHCAAFGSVTVTGTEQFIGGLVGNHGPTITGLIQDSSANVIVSASGSNRVGGFVGRTLASAIINRSFSLGNILDAISVVGGFVGEHRDATIRNSYTIGNISASGSSIGGFVGTSNSASGVLESNYSSVTSSSVDGAFVGSDTSGTFTNNYWNNDLVSDTDDAGKYEGLTVSEMENSANYTGWDFVNTWRVFSGDTPEIK